MRTRDFKKLRVNEENKQQSVGNTLNSGLWEWLQSWFIFGLESFQVKLSDQQILASAMGDEVPLVLESKKLLDKLEQNQLGGIDPFGAISAFIPFSEDLETTYMFGLHLPILKVVERLKLRAKVKISNQ